MPTRKDLYLRCRRDPQFESEHVSKRPLRGPQAEIIKMAEKFVLAHEGGVMPVRCSRQTGKNEIAAVLHRRHLWRRQKASQVSIWVRTAPTYLPQIVNSKKRLKEVLRLDTKKVIHHPLFHRAKLTQEEGYIWRHGNAAVEFISSGPHANVVGATANECLDMDEAHKIDQKKFDEDFAPFTASTNAATLLWGVASDELDTLEWYRQRNLADGKGHLNLDYPCEIWMDVLPAYRAHVEERSSKLGYDHPIIKTQYRLIPVSAEGKFISGSQARSLLDSDHDRELMPRPGQQYEMMIDLAGGNEEFNPAADLEGNEDTTTDSTVVWIYEVSPLVAVNGLFPILRLVNLEWWTGADLPKQETEISKLIEHWGVRKVTVDAVGIGRQISESLVLKYGDYMVNAYTASSTSVSEDCFDLLARLNFGAVKMFRNDGSPEWLELERQVGWTKYASSKGKMNLIKPKAECHIDMVKGLTYINQNRPVAGMTELYSVEGEYS